MDKKTTSIKKLNVHVYIIGRYYARCFSNKFVANLSNKQFVHKHLFKINCPTRIKIFPFMIILKVFCKKNKQTM